MQAYRRRLKAYIIKKYLGVFPAVALLGTRQVGKSTLAKRILMDVDHSVYLDLEDPRDFAKLQEPLAFLEANSDNLICIDEVQMFPEIFQIFRTYLDRNNCPGQLLLLGSASRDLIKRDQNHLPGESHSLRLIPLLPLKLKIQNVYGYRGGILSVIPLIRR